MDGAALLLRSEGFEGSDEICCFDLRCQGTMTQFCQIKVPPKIGPVQWPGLSQCLKVKRGHFHTPHNK